jgi:glycosyltransferase involved in cell wall biosynthesis
VTVYRLPPGGSARGAVVAKLREIRPQVVHCVDTGRATVPGTLAYARESKALALVDMPDWMPAWQRLRSKLTVIFERSALAQADAVLVASRELLAHYQQRKQRAKLYYLPFAVDMQVFEQYRYRAAEVRKKYGDVKLLTYLGTLISQYSPEEALGMARELAWRDAVDFRLLYVGRGPLQKRMAVQAKRWGIADRVEFVGFVPEEDLPGYLAASDVLLCPLEDNVANRTRCPSKAFWYLAARRPIVATHMGEVYRAIEEDGLYYEYGNAGDFADKVELALAGKAPIPSEERAYANSWAAVADRYEALLEDLRPK